MAFLDELKRKLQLAQMQQGQQPTAVMNDPGISGRDTVPSDVVVGQPPAATPAPPQPSWQGLVRQRLTPASVMNAQTAVAQGKADVLPSAMQPQQQTQQQSQVQVMPQSVYGQSPSYRDRVVQDETTLNQLENQPVGFWKRFGTGLLQRAITRRGEAPIPITKRQRDIARTQGQLARDMKVGEVQAQIGSEEALQHQRELEPIFQAQKQQIEQDRIAGVISNQQAIQKQRELDRQSRETIANLDRASREKIAGNRVAGGGLTPYQQQEISDKDAARESKRQAAQDELDQLTKDEATAGENKNKAYDYLAQLKANPNVAKEDIAQATKAAEEADKAYQSYASKKVDAQTAIKENTRAPRSSAPAAAPKQGVTLQGAIDAFKAQAKRDPTRAEISRIKRHYGLE